MINQSPLIAQGTTIQPQPSPRSQHAPTSGTPNPLGTKSVKPSGEVSFSGMSKRIVATHRKKTRHLACHVSTATKDGKPELKADSWPQKLMMQFLPKKLIGSIDGAYLKNCKSVLFHFQPGEGLDYLTKVLSSGRAGCVHFHTVSSAPRCDIEVLILMYTAHMQAFLGFIPNDQDAYVTCLRKAMSVANAHTQTLSNI